MSACTRYPDDEVVLRYVTSDLAEPELAAFEDHMFACDACLARVERYQMAQQSLAGRDLPAPPTVVGGTAHRQASPVRPLTWWALGAIAANIGRLYGAGARHFLVWSAPNPALTPAVRRLAIANPGIAQLAAALTQSFNANLAGILTQLSALPGIGLDGLDAYTLLNEIVADGTRFGLTNVTQACITPYEAPFACTEPDEFLFWDGIHPTSAVHGIIAQQAASVLGQ